MTSMIHNTKNKARFDDTVKNIILVADGSKDNSVLQYTTKEPNIESSSSGSVTH